MCERVKAVRSVKEIKKLPCKVRQFSGFQKGKKMPAHANAVRAIELFVGGAPEGAPSNMG
jgi:hypothetical protein